MIQEVQTYQGAVAAADEAYSQAAANRDAAHEAAWTELGEADNAFVAWAVAQVNEHGQYKRATLAILAALTENPTAQDVRNAARESGYDTVVLTEAVAQAVAAGVLSDTATEVREGTSEAPSATPGQARRRFLDRVRTAMGSHAVPEAERMLNEVVAEESGR